MIRNFVVPLVCIVASHAASSPAFSQEACHTETTSLFVPVRISTATLHRIVNQDVPKQMEGVEGISISGVKDEQLLWWMRRGEIHMTADDGRLRADTRVSATVRVKGKVRPFGPSFSVSVDLGVDVTLWIDVMIRDEWRLDVSVHPRAIVREACINTPVGCISVRSKVQGAANEYVKGIANRIRDELQHSDLLRRAGEKVWRESHHIQKLSESSDAWLVVAPVTIGTTSPQISENGVDLGLFIAANTSIEIGDDIPFQTVPKLPLLQVFEEQLDGTVDLVLPILVGWNALNDIVSERLRADPIVMEHYSGTASFVSNISMSYHSKESIALSVTVDIKTTEHADLVDAQIVVKTSLRPYLLDDGRSIGLRSTPFLIDLVRRYTDSENDAVEDRIEEYMVIDMTEFLDRTVDDVQERVDQFTDRWAESGISVSIDVLPSVRLSNVSIRSSGVATTVCVAATVGAEIYEAK